MHPDEFLNRWAPLRTVRFKPNVVDSANLPIATKAFLIHAGLPESATLYKSPPIVIVPFDDSPVSFELQRAAYRFLDNVHDRLLALCELRHLPYLGLNMDFGYSEILCIEEITGSVWYRRSDKDVLEFVNSSLPTYCQFLVELHEIKIPHGRNDMVDAWEERLRLLDPPAMQNGENFWPLRVDDMRD